MTEDFLDVRNHSFFRVAVISPRVHLGNPMACAQEHLALIKKVAQQGAQYILCPELGLKGGYSLGDLHFQQTLNSASLNALRYLINETGHLNVLITVGTGLQFDYFNLNCAVTFCGHRVLAIVAKEYLPNEGEFYEERHWATSRQLPFKSVVLLEQKVPIGDDIIIDCKAHPGVKIYTPVCEADWVPVPTSGFATLNGATIIANVSASNVTIGKDEYRENLFKAASGRNNGAYLYTSAGFGESTSDHSWDGHMFIAERGAIKKSGERYSTEGTYIISDLDIQMLIADRQRQHSFRANAEKYRDVLQLMPIVSVLNQLGGRSLRPHIYQTLLVEQNLTPFIPISSEQRLKRCREVFHQQSTSLVRRLSVFKPESRKLHLGLSGGSDSTHALTVAIHAMDSMGLPRTNIIAHSMPGFGTSQRTKHNAEALAKAAGVTFRVAEKQIPGSPTKTAVAHLSNEMFKVIGFEYDTSSGKQPVVFENVQAWTRTHILLATAAKEGGIVLGTGDMSELALGWCTLFGDHPLHYGINAGVVKTLILYMIGFTKDVIFQKEPEVQAVLQSILDTDISPELLPLKNGEIAQKTEELVGPFVLHDFFLYYIVRFGFGPRRILRQALHDFEGTKLGDATTIVKWLEFYLRRFFGQQYKRNIMSDGPKIGLVSLNPRGDWRMPSDADVTAWINELEEFKIITV
jgi:NAD+ synthase (glutamine-hydrolysing)